MPSMASDSCHMTSGCSGLPKLRQLTTASGRAPTQARFSTDSATVSAVPCAGIDGAPAVVAVGGEGQAAAGVDAGDRVLQPQHGGVAARALDGVEEQLVVVLRPHPRRVGEHVEQVGAGVGRWSGSGRAGEGAGGLVEAGRGLRGAGRRAARPRAATPPGTSASTSPSQPSRIRSRPPSASPVAGPGVTRPMTDWPAPPTARRSPSTSSRSVGLDDGEHALLGLAGHDLERLHALLAAAGWR